MCFAALKIFNTFSCGLWECLARAMRDVSLITTNYNGYHLRLLLCLGMTYFAVPTVSSTAFIPLNTLLLQTRLYTGAFYTVVLCIYLSLDF